MNRYDESNKVTIISILLNIGLTVIKVIAGILGNSTAIIADGLHSASDIITSIGILIGNRISRKPRDDEHQYGHEKAESLVSFILASVLIIVALKLGYDGVKNLININKPISSKILFLLNSITITLFSFNNIIVIILKDSIHKPLSIPINPLLKNSFTIKSPQKSIIFFIFFIYLLDTYSFVPSKRLTFINPLIDVSKFLT